MNLQLTSANPLEIPSPKMQIAQIVSLESVNQIVECMPHAENGALHCFLLIDVRPGSPSGKSGKYVLCSRVNAAASTSHDTVLKIDDADE